MTLRLLIIGNGMAATRLVEKLSESTPDRYAITMIIRTTCFFMIFFVHGWARVVCVGLAAILPAIGVVLANARENRTPPQQQAPAPSETVEMPMLTSGHVIRGEVDPHWDGR